MNLKELKFRVYDNKQGKYLDLENKAYFLGLKRNRDDTLDIGRFQRSKTQDNEAIIDYEHSDFDFELYTTIRDKNGEWVYDGDIVKLTSKDKILENIVVYFSTESYVFYAVDSFGKYISDLYDVLTDYEIEVVDNIHSHKRKKAWQFLETEHD